MHRGGLTDSDKKMAGTVQQSAGHPPNRQKTRVIIRDSVK